MKSEIDRVTDLICRFDGNLLALVEDWEENRDKLKKVLECLMWYARDIEYGIVPPVNEFIEDMGERARKCLEDIL